MMVSTLLVVLAIGVANEQVLDGVQYADTQAAAKVWTASGVPGIRLVKDAGHEAIELAAPFATEPKLERVYADRKLQLDLSIPGEFAVEMFAADPTCIAQVSLYFKSGNGWYAAASGLAKRGWQTLRFSKASFRIEENPAGWNKIDAVRIAAWRGAAIDSSVRIGRLAAVWHDVALVIPSGATRHGQKELQAALSAANGVADMLGELGLGADAVDADAVTHGALAGRHVAILAYNPVVEPEVVAALEHFVEAGGKLMVCYHLPPRLQKLLGFGKTKYVRPQRPDLFSEVRFDAADVPGLPPSMKQTSWNITTAEPIGHGARVIGRWYDQQGQPADHAAMLLSDRGAYFTHILLTDDRTGKRQMLAAVLGKLYPPLWPEMVRGESQRGGQVGHLSGTEELTAYVKASNNATAGERLESGFKMLRAAQDSSDRKEYPQAVEQLRKGHDLLAEAYLRATPSVPREGRAFWNHSGTGAYPGDWDRTARELAAGGFNMIVPNMLWAGVAYYSSDILPRGNVVKQYGDQVAQCVAAAHRHGLEVHVWKVNYNLSNAPHEFVDQLRREGRTQVSHDGKPLDWLCPSHPENFKLELESMLEVARKYEVDGLHFDYIRYPDGDHCYCDGCRSRFEAQSGSKVARWPQDCFRGSRREEYRQWRCQQITRLVEAVHRDARKIRPAIKISAAVFGSYPGCKESVGQDWVAWAKSGYLDFICPMDYTESDLSFAGLVSGQLKLLGGRVPVYAGIGATASRSGLSPDRVVGQIHHARKLGAAGFTVFNLDRMTSQGITAAMALGAGTQKAVPPHHQ